MGKAFRGLSLPEGVTVRFKIRVTGVEQPVDAEDDKYAVFQKVPVFGAGFGLPARWMSLFAGLALVYLSVSGLVMYFQMSSRRRKGGHSRFVRV